MTFPHRCNIYRTDEGHVAECDICGHLGEPTSRPKAQRLVDAHIEAAA